MGLPGQLGIGVDQGPGDVFSRQGTKGVHADQERRRGGIANRGQDYGDARVVAGAAQAGQGPVLDWPSSRLDQGTISRKSLMTVWALTLHAVEQTEVCIQCFGPRSRVGGGHHGSNGLQVRRVASPRQRVGRGCSDLCVRVPGQFCEQLEAVCVMQASQRVHQGAGEFRVQAGLIQVLPQRRLACGGASFLECDPRSLAESLVVEQGRDGTDVAVARNHDGQQSECSHLDLG